MAALQKVGVAHCDIKLENVLLNHFYIPKIADFGLADCGQGAGTDTYKAPEHNIFGAKFDKHKADAWSYGVLCYRLLENERPLSDEQQELNKKG